AGQGFEILDQRAAALGERRAFGRDLDLPRAAMQEPDTEPLLQALQPLARDGGREIERARGGADRAQVQHAQKQANVFDAVHDFQGNGETDSTSRRCYGAFGRRSLPIISSLARWRTDQWNIATSEDPDSRFRH